MDTLGHPQELHQEIYFHVLVGDVFLADLHVWIAIYEIRIYNKLDLVRPSIVWLGQSKTNDWRR